MLEDSEYGEDESDIGSISTSRHMADKLTIYTVFAGSERVKRKKQNHSGAQYHFPPLLPPSENQDRKASTMRS